MAVQRKITVNEIKEATMKILKRFEKQPNLNEWEDDYDGDDYNEYEEEEEEKTPWQEYVSDYDNEGDCPFNRYKDGVDDIRELLQWCFDNEFLFYTNGRWYAANSLGRQCAIMSDVANYPSVHATHEVDEEVGFYLERRMSSSSRYALLKVRPSSNESVYYILYEE